MNTIKVGTLNDGVIVYERHTSHISVEKENIYGIVAVMCQEIESGEDFIVYTEDFGRVVGETVCVATTDDDDIVYVQREKRKGFSRFVKGRHPESSTKMTMVLMKDKKSREQQYVLITAYVGPAAPPEPWDPHAHSNSREFWDTHALVWGSVPVVSGTETSMCPW